MLKILIILILLFLVSLFVKLQVLLRYFRSDKKDKLEVGVKFANILLFKKDIPLIDIGLNEKRYGLRIDDNNLLKKIGFKPFIDFKTTVSMFQKIKVLKEIDIKIDLGFIDPALTAIIIGSCYSIIPNAINYIFKSAKIIKNKVNIIPYFNQNILKVDFACIIVMSVGNIIYVAIRFLFAIIIKYINANKNKKLNYNIH